MSDLKLYKSKSGTILLTEEDFRKGVALCFLDRGISNRRVQVGYKPDWNRNPFEIFEDEVELEIDNYQYIFDSKEKVLYIKNDDPRNGNTFRDTYSKINMIDNDYYIDNTKIPLKDIIPLINTESKSGTRLLFKNAKVDV